MGRRILFAISVCYLQHSPISQLFMFMAANMSVLIMIGFAWPLATPTHNKLELYNNISLLVASYCLLCFTPFVHEAGARYSIGYALIFVTF